MHENMDKMRVRRKDANQPPPCVPTSPSLTPPDSRIKNLKYVIFPDNRWIQVWDLFMIFAIWNYAFSIPFSFGISRGYYSATSQGYWIYRVIINIGFFGKIARIPATMVSFEHVSFKQNIFNQVLFHFSPTNYAMHSRHLPPLLPGISGQARPSCSQPHANKEKIHSKRVSGRGSVEGYYQTL
jgi:hypothetical protein